jgi:hypothetical protein
MVIQLDWPKKKEMTLIEPDWPNMLVDKDEKKSYIIQADQV